MGTTYWIKTIIKLTMFGFISGSSTLFYISQGDFIGVLVSTLFTVGLMIVMVHRSDMFVDSRPKYQSIAKTRDPRSLVIPLV